ncbi:hypothetical protein DVH05_010671 [Phytophthora capsici]|nr:hypothetical protein DVH05_010671 [Phytophthora capsici]
MKCQWIVFAALAVATTSANPEGSSSVDNPDIALPNFPPLPLPPKDPLTGVPTTFQIPVIRNTKPATPPPSPPLNPSPPKKESTFSTSTSASQDTFREALTETNSNSTGKTISASSTDGRTTLSAITPPSQEEVKVLSSPTTVTPSSASQDTFREVITARNTGSSSSEVKGLDNTASSNRSGSSGEVGMNTGSVKTPAGTGANDGGGVKTPGRNGETGAVVTNGSDTSAASRAAVSALLILMAAAYAAL